VKILIVDDNELIVNLINKNLLLEGYETIVAFDGEQALEMARRHAPDLIILDIMLPKADGFQVCRELQDTDIPIIMLTAKSDISDKLIGLELGADDYIVKPFDTRELLARVKVIFRRLEKVKKDNSLREQGLKGLRIIEDSRRVLNGDVEIRLTLKEFDLLLNLYKNQEIVLTRDQLLDCVWGFDFIGDSRTVDIHIQRLRRKMGEYGNRIETVFGVGYRYRGEK
jgi:DNA-binding response OmpR family regulator